MGGFNVTKNRNIVTLHLFLFSQKSIRQRPYCDPTPVFTERQRPSCDPIPVSVFTGKHTTTAQLWPHTCLCLHITHDNGPIVTPHLSLSAQKNTRQRPSYDHTCVFCLHRKTHDNGPVVTLHLSLSAQTLRRAGQQLTTARRRKPSGAISSGEWPIWSCPSPSPSWPLFSPGGQFSDAYPQPPMGVTRRHWWRVIHPVGLQLRRQLLPVRHHGSCRQSGATLDDEVWRRGQRVQKACAHKCV